MGVMASKQEELEHLLLLEKCLIMVLIHGVLHSLCLIFTQFLDVTFYLVSAIMYI